MCWTIYSSRFSRRDTRRFGSGKSRAGPLSAIAALIFGFAILLQTSQTSVANTATGSAGTIGQPEQRQPAMPPAPTGLQFGVFGSIPLKATISPYAAKWADLKTRIERERGLYDACERGDAGCTPGLRAWQAELAALRGLPQIEQIRGLNRRINRLVTYREDPEAFGQRDYWATPLESLNGKGDCEDYAILKFYSLLQLGFSDDQLRLAIVRDTRRRLLHAVTTVEIDGRTYVLDNLFDDPVEHQYVLKYAPSYSANLTEQWVHIVTREIRAKFVDHVERELSRKQADREDMVRHYRRQPGREFAVDPVALRSAWT